MFEMENRACLWILNLRVPHGIHLGDHCQGFPKGVYKLEGKAISQELELPAVFWGKVRSE